MAPELTPQKPLSPAVRRLLRRAAMLLAPPAEAIKEGTQK